MVKITVDPADKWFSKYIRLRDGKCLRCFSPVKYNAAGDPITHQCSHFYGRRKEATRFDPENAHTVCYGCHQYWHENPEEYKSWLINRIGQVAFDHLMIRANSYCKRDRKMAELVWKQAYADLSTGK